MSFRRALAEVLIVGVAIWSVVATADARSGPREVPLDRLHSDAEVFLRVHASKAQIARIRNAIDRSRLVEAFSFLTKQDALREYRRIGLRGSPSAAELPVSFRVQLRNANTDAEFTEHFENLDGVDSISSHTTLIRAERAAICSPHADLEVFLVLNATPAQESSVRSALIANPVVRSEHFVSQAEALRIFRCIFAPEKQLLRATRADDLPPSFRAIVAPGADMSELARQLKTLPAVHLVKKYSNAIPQTSSNGATS